MNNDCKSLENKKDILENKLNISLINREKIERKYDKIITRNIDNFYKRKKNTKVKKKEKHNEIKKNDINFLKGNYMFKNMIDYRTDQIKLTIKNKIKSPVEMLFYHIKEHDFDEFVELFERKQIDLDSRNKENDSFLIYAVKCKAMKFVLYLLKKGINVNLENKLGNTALHYAFSDQNFQLADVLLKYGADEFKTNIYGKTPWQCLGKKKI
jgi:ankyrin repeat protein